MPPMITRKSQGNAASAVIWKEQFKHLQMYVKRKALQTNCISLFYF